MFRIDRECLGEHSLPETREVERGAIRKFAQALGLANPLHFSSEAARAAGFRDLLAPPTFAITLLSWNVPGVQWPAEGVIHGEQTLRLGEPICAGDVITVSGWVDDVKSRRAARGSMHIVSLVSQGFHQWGQEAFWAKAVLIVTENEEAPHADRR
ncbi:MAG: MaoC family dehydratase N-terminal domain-containing protein [Firmicutes bacterium]|nr:MaoC family dehydratase N-terminal domain-containing protein [Bacillota bacterium]